ncbi:MAG: chitobiase/beta-hexosaminidase C-terminal domain-containing protein [Bacteroides sp.]|nr:chitobiase/beta-hexosaminidase C-terminal domain-containing protein [Bacteroides sp.]MCM1457227.1 chitobiase/beta-hexosaminidase C-terminal domain-containing protein [Lachnoclostridium sp.]
MKKLLLLFGFLTLLFAGSATAQDTAQDTEKYYTITFKTATSDSSKAINESTDVSSIIDDESTKYITGFSVETSKPAYAGKEGLKLGTSSKVGYLAINISEDGQVVPTKIIVSAKIFGSDNANDLKIGFNSSQAIKVGTLSKDFNDFTWSQNTTSTLKQIKIENSAKRAYVASVTVYYKENGDQDPDPVAPNAPTFSVNGGTYTEAQTIEISAESNANIYYTLDNSEPSASSTLYNGAITISETTTIKAIAVRNGLSSSVATATYTIEPTVEPDPTPTPSEEGYYLTDITKLVSGDIVVIVDKNSSRALNSSNGSASAPAATQVTLNADKSKLTSTPDNNLLYKIEVSGQNYKFATVTNEKDYLYTTSSNNGVRIGTNTNNTFSWTSNFLKNTSTNRYIGVYNNSDWRCYTTINDNIKNTQTAFYKYVKGDGAPAAPTFSLAEGTYTEPKSVEIFATNGSSIFYTIDGTEPTADSTPYTGAISIDKTTTVKAIAVRDGKASAVASATYTIDIPAPSAPVITINGAEFNGATYEYEIGKVVPVTVSAKGAESITYTIDGETATATGSSYTFYVSTDCSCSFFATNTVGDSETVTISFVGVEKPYTFYQIVTSTDQLEYGKEVIIAHDGSSSVAMSTTQNANNRPETAVDMVARKYIVNPGDEVQMITLIEDYTATDDYKWNLYVGLDAENKMQYLYVPVPDSNVEDYKKNYLKTTIEPDANANASIAIGTDGSATIEFNASISQRYLQYNPSGNIFSCYAQTQKNTYLYTKVDGYHYAYNNIDQLDENRQAGDLVMISDAYVVEEDGVKNIIVYNLENGAVEARYPVTLEDNSKNKFVANRIHNVIGTVAMDGKAISIVDAVIADCNDPMLAIDTMPVISFEENGETTQGNAQFVHKPVTIAHAFHAAGNATIYYTRDGSDIDIKNAREENAAASARSRAEGEEEEAPVADPTLDKGTFVYSGPFYAIHPNNWQNITHGNRLDIKAVVVPTMAGAHLWNASDVAAISQGITTGITDITPDDANATYYTIQGIRVDAPAAGNIYIRVANGQASKVRF